MFKRTKKIQPKSKEMIREAADIIINSDDDAAAIGFLRDTLDDDFPDLELGSMDLHDAIKVLEGSQETVSRKRGLENLNNAFESFMNKPKPKETTKRKTTKKAPRKAKRKPRRNKS